METQTLVYELLRKGLFWILLFNAVKAMGVWYYMKALNHDVTCLLLAITLITFILISQHFTLFNQDYAR